MPTVCATLSSRGRQRSANEDRVYADPGRGLYVVSDGMGGLRGGAATAQFVVDTLPGLVARRPACGSALSPDRWQALADAVIAELNAQVRAADPTGRDAMGATVVLLVLRGSAALLAHLGDSRAYLLREGRLVQLTQDHSIAQLLVSSGRLSAEEAAAHPGKAQLTRYVGMPGRPLPETRVVQLEPGDRLLLCSDGLTSELSHERLRGILAAEPDPAAACRELVAAADVAGGADNVSVVAIDPAGGHRTRLLEDGQMIRDTHEVERSARDGAFVEGDENELGHRRDGA